MTQPCQPAFGSSMFGSSTPFGASSTPAFGATSTPTIGGTSAPAFGATSTPTPAFGATSNPAFGSTGFGVSSSPLFGFGGRVGASSTLAFGSSSTPAFGASSTPAFGTSSTVAFGASSTCAFGTSSSPSFSVGSTPAFGQPTSVFGSSPFGAFTSPFGQNSVFGAQSTTPAFGSSGFGKSAFWGQSGSRVAAYAPTPEPDSGTSETVGKFVSIHAMPVYKDKIHEELRWEDYQRGDKGGPLSAGQSSGINFGSSTTISNLLGPTPLFGQSSSSLFSSSISSNLFAPETPGFGSTGFGTSSSTFSSSSFGASSTSGLFQSSSLSTPSLFGSTYAFGSSSSPSPFSSSSTGFGQSVFSSPQVQGSAPVFSSSLFSSFAPPIGQAGAAFVHSTSSFGQTVSGFGQSSLFSTPSTGFGNFLSSTPSIGTSINPLGFSQTAGEQMGIHVSFSIQCVISQMKNDNGINPFGTLPAMPQMSIGCGGTAPSVQYGIASMLVLDKPAPVRISSSLTSRYVSQRRIRLPSRKYHHKNDGPKG